MALLCEGCGKELWNTKDTKYRLSTAQDGRQEQTTLCLECDKNWVDTDTKTDSNNISNSTEEEVGSFADVGKKIKRIAKVAYILGITIFTITGFVVMLTLLAKGNRDLLWLLLGVTIISLGWLISWIWSLLVYGFGELIDKTNQIAENTRKK